MNAPESLFLPDVQSAPDERALAIDRVGVKGVRYPITLASAAGGTQATVAEFDLYVALPPQVKGTHMSRFLEWLEAHREPFAVAHLPELMADMLVRLEAAAGYIEARFPYFVEKAAPVSGVKSLLDYAVAFRAESKPGRALECTLQVTVPVTSLCPCSKKISDYGAHNQRSHITIAATLAASAEPVAIEGLIAIAESQASCELYGLLKRPDEKYVTERAYDNPKFVEDLVRDIALALDGDARVAAFTVESENFESIHNHSAYALISRDKRAG
jgi:GTP cyclohydrolase FolE2